MSKNVCELHLPSGRSYQDQSYLRPRCFSSVCFPTCSSYSSYHYSSSLRLLSLSSPYFSLPSMRPPRSENLREYAATALCHILVTIVVAQLVSLAAAAPTALSISDLASLKPCQQIDCYTGHAVLDPEIGSCVCPGSDTFRVSPINLALIWVLTDHHSCTKSTNI